MNSSAGFKIEPFGKGRNAIQSAYANELVDCLNPLGNISIVRGKEDKVFYSDVGVALQLKDSTASTSITANPFTIYNTTSWLKYKVTAGYVVRGGNPITATGIESEFTISGSVLRYWFYIELTDTTAEIKTSSTTLTWGCELIPIGWVDTLTGLSATSAQIYQLNRDHIFSPIA